MEKDKSINPNIRSLSIPDVAREIGVTRQYVSRLCDCEKLRSYQLPNLGEDKERFTRRVLLADLEQFIKERLTKKGK